jgi:alpha-L-arabinofuranosidase
MVHDAWQPNAVSVAMTGGQAKANETKGVVSAQVSDDGKTVVVRYVNGAPNPVHLQVTIQGFDDTATATLSVLHAAALSDANTPSEPMKVSPVTQKPASLSKISVPANSFVVLLVVK